MDYETILHLAIVAGFAAIVVFAFGYFIWRNYWMKIRGIKAPGVVVDLVPKITKGDYTNNFADKTTYFPVIEYRTHTWEAKKIQHDIDFGASMYKIGDKVNVIYDKRNVERFVIV